MNSILLKYFSYKGTSTLTKFEFVILNALSLGLYSVYWAWAAWETIRLKEKRVYRIKSSVRAIALPLSSFWLFPRLSKISRYNFWPYPIAIVYFLFVCAGVWISTDQVNTLRDLVAYVITGVVEAALLLPAFEAQSRASSGIKAKGINKPLAWVLSVLFVIAVPTFFITV